MTEESLFTLALARPPAERAALLDAACAGDPALRGRLEELLAAHEQAGGFLDPPVTTPYPAAPDQATPTGGAGGGAEQLPPEVVAGRYRVVRPLGEGGMGVVYLAEQEEPVRRQVAVKVLRPGMGSAALLARFGAERQALAVMDHPNIAKVLDGGTTDDGRPFFVMELVAGVPLTQFCDSRRLTVRERLGLFLSSCDAVQHAHQKGVVH